MFWSSLIRMIRKGQRIGCKIIMLSTVIGQILQHKLLNVCILMLKSKRTSKNRKVCCNPGKVFTRRADSKKTKFIFKKLSITLLSTIKTCFLEQNNQNFSLIKASTLKNLKRSLLLAKKLIFRNRIGKHWSNISLITLWAMMNKMTRSSCSGERILITVSRLTDHLPGKWGLVSWSKKLSSN